MNNKPGLGLNPNEAADAASDNHSLHDGHADEVEAQLPAAFRSSKKDREHLGTRKRYHLMRRRLGIKNIVICFIAEFLGTLIFLLMAFGVATQSSQRASALAPDAPLDVEGLLFSSLGFGFSLAISAWTFFRISGGLFNPALAFALFLTGALDFSRFITCSVAEYIGAIAAAALLDRIVPGGVDAATKLANGTTVGQGFWIEFFMTSQLIFAVFMLAGEKHKGTFLAPIGIGLSLLLAELFATRFTGGSLNPARTLGPDVISSGFQGFTWIYYIAPYSAALVTSGFYLTLKWVQYETVVPDQDADDAIEQKQILRDGDGKVVAAIDNIAAADFKGVEVAKSGKSESAASPKEKTPGSDNPYDDEPSNNKRASSSTLGRKMQ